MQTYQAPFFFAIRKLKTKVQNPMSRIRLLPDTVASQVAAGEVVERPASIVKELIENSIDAGARKIQITIHRGGMSLIRMIDDGCGMDRDDALLSLERHATSKIRSAADLQAVGTLGFRGEALPSIASVSRFRLTTREPNENTEGRNIEHQIHLQAIGHPQIAVTLLRDGRLMFQLPATVTLGHRIRDLYGVELLERLIQLHDATSRKIQIGGFIGQAGLSRQTRAQQLIFVNGRAIESGIITAAIREGYHTALMKGQYPVTFVFLDLDPAAVDVNVHPAKREVRFRDPTAVREAVVRCIQQTLECSRAEWQQKFRAPRVVPEPVRTPGKIPEAGDRELSHVAASFGDDSHKRAEFVSTPPVMPSFVASQERGGPGHAKQAAPSADSAAQQFQIIGVLNKLYVLMENAEGLVLVDQHAAHERILFEDLRQRMEEQGVPAQKLLLPQTFDLPPRDADWIERNMSTLQKMGIGIESFGPNTFKIDSVPAFLNVSDPTQFMRKVIDDLKSASDSSSAMRLGEEMIAKTVCRHAVKANDPLRYPEVEKLIRDLLDCDLPYCCPHGRPTMIQISLAELEKKFGRRA